MLMRVLKKILKYTVGAVLIALAAVSLMAFIISGNALFLLFAGAPFVGYIYIFDR